MRGSGYHRRSARLHDKRHPRLRDELIQSDPDRCANCGFNYRISVMLDRSTSPKSGGKFATPTREPRILKCGHIICSGCLTRGLEETSAALSCPFCEALINEPLESYPISFHNLGRILLTAEAKGKTDSILDTSSAFLSTSILSDLNSSISEISFFESCPKHEEPLSLKCESCANDNFICEKCLLPGERHHEHFVSPYEPIGEINNNVQEAKEAVIKQKLEERNRLRTEIIRYFDGFHGKLSYAEHNSLEKIDAIYDDFLTQLARENFAEEMGDFLNCPLVEFDHQPVMILANTSKAPELNLTTNELKIRRKGRPFYDEKFLGMTNLAQSDPDTSISHSDDQIQITHINNPGDFYVIRVKDKLKIHELSKSIKSKEQLLEKMEVEDLKVGGLCLISRRTIHFESFFAQPIVRARVIAMETNFPFNYTNPSLTLHHLDSGFEHSLEFNKSSIFYPIEEFFDSQKFPVFAVRCKLHNIVPNYGEKEAFMDEDSKSKWSSGATNQLEYLTSSNRTMFAKVIGIEDNVTIVDIRMRKTFDASPSFVSDFLVFMGNAKFDQPNRRFPLEAEKCEKYQYVSLSKEGLSRGQVHSVLLAATSEKMDRIFFHILSSKDGENSRETHSEVLSKTLAEMAQFYEANADNGDILIDCPRVGQPCAIFWKNGDMKNILRGQITKVKKGKPGVWGNVQVDSPIIEVYAVDEGTVKIRSLNQIRQIPPKYMRIPKLAIQARLSGIEIDEDKAYREFVLACGDKPLLANIDYDLKSPEEVELTLYYKEPHKLINVNALMVFKGCARLLDPTEPFYKRVEYMLDDPDGMPKESWPVFTGSNVTFDTDILEALQDCELGTPMLAKTGHVIAFVSRRKSMPMVNPDENRAQAVIAEMQLEYEKFKETDDDKWLDKEIGELCCVKHDAKWIRARITKLIGEKITEVLNVDTGDFIKIDDGNPVLALYSDYHEDLDLVLVPMKISGVQFDSLDDFNTCLIKMGQTRDTRLKYVETRRNDGKYRIYSTLANIPIWDLIEGLDIPEIRLILEHSTGVTPFGQSIKYFFDFALRAFELDLVSKIDDEQKLDPQFWPYRKAKLKWPDPMLPIHVTDDSYAKLRSEGTHCASSDFFDFSGKVTYVDLDGSIYLDLEESISALVSLNAKIEAIYLDSRPKLHDQFWYVGEPCIAQFSWDNKWYRGTVVKITEENQDDDQALYSVKFVDYANETVCYKSQLRKDLVGLEIPPLVTRVVLDGVTFNELFNAAKLHETLVDQTVQVQLTQPPTKMPMVGNVFLTNDSQKIDLKNYLAFQRCIELN